MKQKIKKINLGERMFGYEKVTKNQLMPKQPAIVKVNLRHYDKFTNNLLLENKSLDIDIASAFALTIRNICEEVGNIVFAFYQKDEVLFLLRDDQKQEQEQYFKGDIQKITSTISSKFTYQFNNYLSKQLKYDNYEPAYFSVAVYNLPYFEVENNFIFKQQESIKQFIGTKYANGICFYKVEFPVVIKQELIEKIILNKFSEPKKQNKNQWVIDIQPPIFSKEKSFIEKFLI